MGRPLGPWRTTAEGRGPTAPVATNRQTRPLPPPGARTGARGLAASVGAVVVVVHGKCKTVIVSEAELRGWGGGRIPNKSVIGLLFTYYMNYNYEINSYQ